MNRTYATSKPKILAAAVKMARDKGLMAFTLRQTAREAGVAIPTVHYHFKCIDVLRREVAQHAVDNELVSLLADARAITRLGITLSAELRGKIATYIAKTP